MEFIAAGTAWALNRAPSLQKILSRLGLASLVVTNTWSELSSKLSPNATIVFPDDPEFSGLVSRWRDWHAPQVGAVVTAFTENDVQEAVSTTLARMGNSDLRQVIYANRNGIPFLARSGGHGATEALQLAKDALVVDIRGMNDIKVAPDGNYATISGGASVKKVVNELWTAKKQTG
ncbi:hypothetical protein SNK03_006514 [Fusarium graminearum]